jgi:hypothetical protein
MSQDSDPAEPVPPEEGSPPPPRPPSGRRNVLIVGVAAAAAAAVVAVVLVTVQPTGQPQRSTGQPQRSTGLAAAGRPRRYTSLPAPCALVPAAMVAGYVPGAVGAGQGPSTSGTTETAACTWSGLADGEVRILTAQVSLYGSATAITDAQNAFNAAIPEPRCNCDYDLHIPGLGDEVREKWTAQGPSLPKRSVTVSAQTSASAVLEARAGNADVLVSSDITPYRVGETVSIRTAAGEITVLAAAAHEILNALAHPGAVPAAPPVVTPQYATPADPCGVVRTGTLTKYLPLPLSTTSKSLDESGFRYSFCIWGSIYSGTQITVSAEIYKSVLGAGGAEQAFPGLAQTVGQNTKGYGSDTITNATQVVTGIGNQALAIFQTSILVANGFTTYNSILVIWSGNANLLIQFNYPQGLPGSTPPPPRAAQVSALVTVARDALAALPRS